MPRSCWPTRPEPPVRYSVISRSRSAIAAALGSLAAGASAGEIYGDSACKTEVARLWSAIERSVEAINLAQAGPGDTQGKAA